jgi:hypothetical protein
LTHSVGPSSINQSIQSGAGYTGLIVDDDGVDDHGVDTDENTDDGVFEVCGDVVECWKLSEYVWTSQQRQ